ncbi:MFS transporter [Amycolatopsis sp. GM8]|uniref:MFS transporter n=1 Tax=Amycolatopsis sp. GM8 TaxID=2896530 RepID=UPI001F0267F8|nr:MFS transporter [Amycolatopsis sp. GM8]
MPLTAEVSASIVGASGLRSPLAWGGFVLAATVLGAFVVIERRRAAPFVPPKLLVESRFARSAVAAMCQMFCLTATLLTIPLYVTTRWGTGSRTAGILVVALPLAMTVLAPAAGLLTERWRPRQALRIGLLCLALAETGLMAVLASGDSGPGPMWTLVATATCIGAGMALTQTPAAAGASRSAQEADSGAGLGVFNMLRFVGAATGGAAVAMILGDSPGGAAPFAIVAAACAGAALVALAVTFAGRTPR